MEPSSPQGDEAGLYGPTGSTRRLLQGHVGPTAMHVGAIHGGESQKHPGVPAEWSSRAVDGRRNGQWVAGGYSQVWF